MSKNVNGGFWASWPVIVIAFICFWPIGLFLLIRKFAIDKRAAVSAGGKGMKVLGIVLIVISSLGFLGFLISATESGVASSDIGGIIFLLFIIAGGIALLRKAKKIDIEAKKIKHYLSIIINGNERQIDTIAATTGKSYDEVYDDINNMIDKGYLKNAYINKTTRSVVLPSDAPATPKATAPSASMNTASAKTKIVTCSCCGANNTIIGDVGECEYCGSPLK